MNNHPELRHLKVTIRADWLARIADMLEEDPFSTTEVINLRVLIAAQTTRKIYKLGDEVKVLGAGVGVIIKENDFEDDYHVMISGTEHIVCAHSSTIFLITRWNE